MDWWRIPTGQYGLSKKDLCVQWLHRVLPADRPNPGLNRGVVEKELLTCTNALLARADLIRAMHTDAIGAAPQRLTLEDLTPQDLPAAKLKAAKAAGNREPLTEPAVLNTAAAVIACYAWPVTEAVCTIGKQAVDQAATQRAIEGQRLDNATRVRLKERAPRLARERLLSNEAVTDPHLLNALLQPNSPEREDVVTWVTDRLLTQQLAPANDTERYALLATPQGRALLEPLHRHATARPLRIAGATADEVDDVRTEAIMEAARYLLHKQRPAAAVDPTTIRGLIQRIVKKRILDKRREDNARTRREAALVGDRSDSPDDAEEVEEDEKAQVVARVQAAIARLPQDGSWEAEQARTLLAGIDLSALEAAEDTRRRSLVASWRRWLAKKWDDCRPVGACCPENALSRTCTTAVGYTLDLIRAALRRAADGGSA